MKKGSQGEYQVQMFLVSERFWLVAGITISMQMHAGPRGGVDLSPNSHFLTCPRLSVNRDEPGLSPQGLLVCLLQLRHIGGVMRTHCMTVDPLVLSIFFTAVICQQLVQPTHRQRLKRAGKQKGGSGKGRKVEEGDSEGDGDGAGSQRRQ